MRPCTLLALASFLFLSGAVLFGVGFFPTKSSLPGIAQFATDLPPPLPSQSVFKPPPARFRRLVLVLIDALRVDFCIGEKSNMKFTNDLVEKGDAFSFIANARAPTVTLPRIKALMSGTVPSFTDVLLNFASDELTIDNLVDQFYRSGKRMVFYGDETWLKLFPQRFIRWEGVTSFFATDTVEVDQNVTRNVHEELRKDDWDVLILHYLGLDHIGHSLGPESALMPAKQREMDEIVDLLFTSVVDNETLLIVAGDHGMAKGGGHGGSSPEETSTALVLASPGLNVALHPLTKVEQSDLVPTLAVLLGLPIPLNSLGVLITPVIRATLNAKDALAACYMNAAQILRLLVSSGGDTQFGPLIDQANQLHDNVLKGRTEDVEDTLSAYENFSRKASLLLIDSSSQINAFYLIVAAALLAVSVLLLITASFLNVDYNSPFLRYFLISMTMRSWALILATSVALSFLISVISANIINFFVCCSRYRAMRAIRAATPKNLFHLMACSGALVHPLLLFSSSFVEEEHQIFYFFFFSALFLQFHQATRVHSLQHSIMLFLALFLHRIVRAWNQTGNKWLGGLDIAKLVVASPHLQNTLSILSLVFIGALLLQQLIAAFVTTSKVFRNLTFAAHCAAFVSAVCAHLNILERSNSLLLIQSVLLVAFFIAIIAILRPTALQLSRTDSLVLLRCALLWVAVHVHRQHNLPLLALLLLQNHLLMLYISNLSDVSNFPRTSLAILFHWLGYTGFFAFGNSNSISSIDFTGIYLCIDRENVPLMGVLTFLLLATSQILSFLSYLDISLRGLRASPLTMLSFPLLLQAFVMASYCLILFAMKSHLFVWSVFAPKYFFELGQSILVVLLTAMAYRTVGLVN